MKLAAAEQQRIVDAFTRAETDPPDFAPLLDPFQYMASANYVVPMLVDLACAKGNEIVDRVPRYSSPDHATVWNDLLACLRRFDAFKMPYFNFALAPDPFAEELLAYEHAKIARRHVISSFQDGMWTLVDDGAGLRIRLAEPMRRSALHLVANKASYLRSPPPVRAVLDDLEQDGSALALANGLYHLDVFAESCPQAWQRLQDGLPFDVQALPGFRAFVLALGDMTDSRWFHANQLWDLWQHFAADRGLDAGTGQMFGALVDFHSLTVDEARAWGTQSPFLRFGDTYLVWFFVFHVLLPDLNFLVLLARRFEKLWSQTVGADLARVADWLGTQLPANDRLRWVARRRRKGVGEADLVLLDTDTGHVLVLELKTVFDKFRTHLQMRNFTEQKVNFSKALKQAQTAAAAIADGRWPLRDLFGKDAPNASTGVTHGVLTWWDTYNPTLGSDPQTLCCNFETLLFVIQQAGGDVHAAATAISELSRVYCPGVLEEAQWVVDAEPMTVRREIQGDALPPPERLAQLALGPLARQLIADLPRWPDGLLPGTEDGVTAFVY
jgi:hypothetical protein